MLPDFSTTNKPNGMMIYMKGHALSVVPYKFRLNCFNGCLIHCGTKKIKKSAALILLMVFINTFIRHRQYAFTFFELTLVLEINET